MHRQLLAATALATALMGAAGVAQAAPSPFGGETMFGDSLSDGGNVSRLEGLATTMRYTTNPGLTAVEDIAAHYGLALSPSLAGGSNYAYGGAGVLTNAPGVGSSVPTETAQITAYLAANPKVSGSELFTVFAGANDIFYHGTAVAAGQFAAATGLPPAFIAAVEGVAAVETPAQALANIQAAASQELTLIGGLQVAGARYVVVFNLPNTGLTPSAAAGEKLVPGTIAEQTLLSQAFNSTLDAGLKSAGVGIVPVNTYALLNEVTADPARYGFVNDTVPACTTSSSLSCTRATLVAPDAYATYVFADGVHPTTTTHALFAQVVESEIIAPQQASLLAEAPLAGLEMERDAVTGELVDRQLAPGAGVRLFARGAYAAEHLDREAYTPALHADDSRVTVGADLRLVPGLVVGAELTGGAVVADLNGQLRRFRTDSVSGSVFAQYDLGRAYLDGQAGYGEAHLGDIQRLFHIGPAVRIESGSTDARTSLASLSGGYWLGTTRLRAGPFLSATYERVHVDGYGEGSADATAMTFGPQTREALVGEAGARLQGRWDVPGAVLRPFTQVAYAYDGDARTRYVLGGLTTLAGQFAIPGYAPDREWGTAQAGVAADLAAGWTATLGYEGRFAGRSARYDGGSIGLKYSF